MYRYTEILHIYAEKRINIRDLRVNKTYFDDFIKMTSQQIHGLTDILIVISGNIRALRQCPITPLPQFIAYPNNVRNASSTLRTGTNSILIFFVSNPCRFCRGKTKR